MLKMKYGCWTAVFFMMSVLLGGCRTAGNGEVCLIGSAAEGPGSKPEAAAPAPEGADPLRAQCEAGASAGEAAVIRVYVCGAVACPGVVEIREGSRIEDALLAAGGFSPEAAREAVNLAYWVSDGQMLYFPTAEEAELPGQMPGGTGVTGGEQLVNINTADKTLLCTLPGIGETRAADIIAYREAHGGFASCEELMQVTGIKTGIYEKICDKITVR